MLRHFLNENMRRELWLSSFCFLIFLGGCTSSEISQNIKCPHTYEREIVATLPEGWGNIETGENGNPPFITNAHGVFIEKNLLLTVSHALPAAGIAEGITPLFRDEKSELLLVKTEECGTPLSLIKSHMQKEENIFFCDTLLPAGTIKDEGIATFSASPVSSYVKILEGVLEIEGEFSSGDSGKGFCNAQRELVGILVSANEERGFLLPAEKIVDFLSSFHDNALAF